MATLEVEGRALNLSLMVGLGGALMSRRRRCWVEFPLCGVRSCLDKSLWVENELTGWI